ncbi:MAG: 4'-phosphopantetheinyl transferase superfamily protein [Caldilineales bacterium]|nr:4'-phosphopantetheinyl transferase superfamily protein [Caldilineales bacterium]
MISTINQPRLHWLLQTTAAAPELAGGIAPPELLHPIEAAQLDRFRVIKRRRDWLLGRWTAKHLIRSVLESETGIRHPLDAMVIQADPDGAPFASLTTTSGLDRLLISLSISHSEHSGFCACWPGEDAQVGADIELIEPRDWPLVETFFTANEQAQVQAASGNEKDILTTAIWSGKEAMLKATRTGLRADTRQVDCHFPNGVASPDRWQPFQARWDTAILPSAQSHFIFRTEWRVIGQHVLTLALLAAPDTIQRYSSMDIPN